MEYVDFVFGIFGLLAYVELSSLKKRVNTLEEGACRHRGKFII